MSSCLKHHFCLSHLSFSLYVTRLLSLPHHFSCLCSFDLASLIVPLFINLPPSLLSAPRCIFPFLFPLLCIAILVVNTVFLQLVFYTSSLSSILCYLSVSVHPSQ